MEGDQNALRDQMKEVITYLGGNQEAKLMALDIILPYTATDSHRSIFENTNASKELLRLLPLVDAKSTTVTVKALKCLINLTQSNYFVTELCSLNVAHRVYDLLKEHVRQDLKAESTNQEAVRFNQGVFEIVK
jgi:hypothetical protein